MMPLPLSAPLEADLKTVDRIVRQRIQSQPVVAEVLGRSTMMGDGLGLRAALALLSAQFGGYSIERVQHVASTVELIAIAAQVHDGLVDQAGRRRGSPSLHATWEHGVPLMIGDYLYALAAGEMALVPDPRAISYFSDAVKQISEGTLTPVVSVRPPDEAERHYLFQAEGRTAALFAAACMAGCAVSGGSDEQIAALGSYGRALGLAYHIAHDAEEYGADATAANGSGGSILRRGLITLPLIYAVAATQDERLAAIIDDSSHDPAQIAWALEQVRAHGVAPTFATARRFRDEALATLAVFNHGVAHQALTELALALVP